MTATELETLLRKGDPPLVTLLTGEESLLMERSLQALLDAGLDQSLKDFNLNVFFGNEVNGVDINDAASTLPMFADRRVVIVKRADLINAAAAENLLPYIKTPSPSTLLILVAPKVDLRKKVFAEIKKNWALVEHKPLYENKLPPFVSAEARRLGKTIDAEATELLIFTTGNNLQELVSQIEKLAVFVGNRNRIAISDIKTAVTGDKEFSPFDFASSLGKRDLKSSLLILSSLIRHKEEGVVIIGALASHFRKLCRIRELSDNGSSQQDIAKELRISPYFMPDLSSQCKNFTIPAYKNIIFELNRCDIGSKTGGDFPTLMNNLIYSVCSKQVRKP